MRSPINPLPSGVRQRITSVAAAFVVDVFESQPGTAGAGGTVPLGQLTTTRATLTDDASQGTARRMTVDVATRPDWLRAGMWLRGDIGIQTLQPIIYRTPALIVTDIAENLGVEGGATLTAEDPSVVLNGRPYEADATIAGTLRSMVAAACTLALSRPTDVSGVPALAVPAGAVAEFGSGRWDACLTIADALGVALRFTDPGDVVGTLRSAVPPSPAGILTRRVTEGGTSHQTRAPTAAKVLVTRGSNTVGLVGSATSTPILGEAPPAWYLPYVVVDRQEGDPGTSQGQADILASDLLRARLSELDTFDSMPILPAPWLEAGVDVVTFRGHPYAVRAVTFEFPTLATSVTLRRIL